MEFGLFFFVPGGGNLIPLVFLVIRMGNLGMGEGVVSDMKGGWEIDIHSY